MTIDLRSRTVPQLKQLAERIATEIARREAGGKAAMLKKFTRLARSHGMSLDELLSDADTLREEKPAKAKLARAPKTPLPIKYRHPSKLDLAWSGRGRKPHWVEAWLAHGGALDALAIAAEKFESKLQRAASLHAATV